MGSKFLIITGTLSVAFLILVAFLIPDRSFPALVNGMKGFYKRNSLGDMKFLFRSFTVSPQCATNGYLACGEAGQNMTMTMEYRSEYACYRFRKTCRKQADGKCGWDKDEEVRVKSCIDKEEYVY